MELFTLLGILVAVVILIAILENEAYAGAVAVTILAMIYAGYTFGFGNSATWILGNIPKVLAGIAAWLAVGAAWSFIRWDRWLAKRVRDGYESAPDWSNHKDKLTAWTFWWPFSIVGYVIGEALKEAWEWVQEKFGALYQKIVEWHYPPKA